VKAQLAPKDEAARELMKVASRWSRTGKHRSANAVSIAKILVLAAGAMAEQGRYGYRSGDRADCAQIDRLLFSLPGHLRREDRLRELAFQLVCRHQQAVERVADALAEKLLLTAGEIDALMPPAWIAQYGIGKQCTGDPMHCGRCWEPVRPTGTYPLPLGGGPLRELRYPGQ
jgi:hypothetical protein